MLALFCLSVSSEPWIAIVFLVLLAITSGMQGTISVPFLSEQYGDQNLGSIKSLVSAISVFATATSPFAIGWLIDQGVSIEYQARVGAVITLAAIILATIGYVVSRRPQYQSL